MKTAIVNIPLFFKRISVLYRLAFIVIPFFVINSLIIPDMKFNWSVKNVKEFTIEELTAMPKDEIPLYIKVKDAQVLKSSFGNSYQDSPNIPGSDATESFLGLEAYQYVLSQRIKKGDTSISYVAYPVYSTQAIEENPGKNASDLPAFVVVKDSKYTKYHEENDNYFTDAKFSIEGQYEQAGMEAATIAELKNAGFLIKDNVIILDKGKSAMGWSGLIILTLIGLFIMTLSFLSFFPENKLRSIFEELPEVKEMVEH
ncbi:hypothetical protein [Chryseosolibacter indicus]|uniref:Uncharacterized protein n=1 Tax=Chryseosolibacter indicus TaxID=2782351 RepID=A0ABS5VS95_9BACT|nr:hypothetical protein [Chryseosolibacter indicus]MBT1704305.1 hypothetical protein [Chryseosolibacter indicus]